MAGLITHILLDFMARCRTGDISLNGSVENKELVQRFNNHFLTQHFLLMISVIVLFISAIFLWGLRFPGAQWATVLSASLGGVEFWRIIHRWGGVLLLFTCAYHFIYCIIHPEGRRDFTLMIPRKNDFIDFYRNILWFVGYRDQRPFFNRFSYFEKFDYWAVFWGCVIMGVTGLGMWFPELVKILVPVSYSVLLDTFKEAHAHEALLAFLAIVIWHFYNVHLRPGRFPGSLFWMHGMITKTEQEREHPGEIYPPKPEMP
jgi:cytochrome b subunit of formate dehydrogenase